MEWITKMKCSCGRAATRHQISDHYSDVSGYVMEVPGFPPIATDICVNCGAKLSESTRKVGRHEKD